MSGRRALLVVGVVGSVTFHAADANAQLRNCAQALWNFVGKPLSAGVIERLGSALGDTIVDRLKGRDQVTLTERDIQRFQREGQARGLSECELRQQLEAAMYAPQDSGPQKFAEPQGPGFVQRTMPASACLTEFGACGMGVAVPVGSACYCPTLYGGVPGIAR